MQNVLKKPIKVPQIMIGEEPILDYFLENESKFSDLNYLITYKNYLRKEKSDYSNESEFLVYEGSKAIIPHLSRGKRYFGNSKMIKCDESEINNRRALSGLSGSMKTFSFLMQCFLSSTKETHTDLKKLKDSFSSTFGIDKQ
jgi:hypothetical protein